MHRLHCRNPGRKKERGGAVDLFEVMMVLVIVFALMLMYFNYAKSIRMKMAIDLAAKNALYQMEETGYWSNEIEDHFKAELTQNGIELCDSNNANAPTPGNTNVKLNNNSSGTTEGPDVINTSGTHLLKPAKYGQQVTLDLTLYFYTPMHDTFGIAFSAANGTPDTQGARAPVTYHILRSTTCRM